MSGWTSEKDCMNESLNCVRIHFEKRCSVWNRLYVVMIWHTVNEFPIVWLFQNLHCMSSFTLSNCYLVLSTWWKATLYHFWMINCLWYLIKFFYIHDWKFFFTIFFSDIISECARNLHYFSSHNIIEICILISKINTHIVLNVWNYWNNLLKPLIRRISSSTYYFTLIKTVL